MTDSDQEYLYWRDVWNRQAEGLCGHCGDGTEYGDDPRPDLCAMCAKAGRT